MDGYSMNRGTAFVGRESSEARRDSSAINAWDSASIAPVIVLHMQMGVITTSVLVL
jgi:hypothetical protein